MSAYQHNPHRKLVKLKTEQSGESEMDDFQGLQSVLHERRLKSDLRFYKEKNDEAILQPAALNDPQKPGKKTPIVVLSQLDGLGSHKSRQGSLFKVLTPNLSRSGHQRQT